MSSHSVTTLSTATKTAGARMRRAAGAALFKGETMNTKTLLQEVMFDMYDQANARRLPPEFRSWKEFYTEQAEKLARIEAALFPKGDEA
jgi:hypothetical protein